MRKYLFITVVMLSSFYAIAQETVKTMETTEQKIKQILPEKGDFAIGIDAMPFFNYIGTMFRISDGAQNTPSFNFMNGTIISGKYMLSSSKALRAGIRIGLNNKTDINMVLKDDGDIGDYVEDSRKLSSTNILLSAGLEYSRGKGRLQGYYGFDATIGFSSAAYTYSYGNTYSTDFPSPLHTIQWEPYKETGHASERILNNKNGVDFLIGAQAFVGVEYFFAKKMSLGGEFSWGPAFLLRGDSTREYESFDDSAETINTHTIESARGNQFSMDSRNANGKISLMFYF